MCKKDKTILMKRLILALKLSFYTCDIKNWFFLKRLRKHVGCVHVHITFLFEVFFGILKCVENKFQIKGAFTPLSQNALSKKTGVIYEEAPEKERQGCLTLTCRGNKLMYSCVRSI
jgi:hypothetical protein